MLRFCVTALTAALLSACAIPAPAPASAGTEVTRTTDLADVPRILAANQNPRTLLVLDIDDTLLTSATFFGSDAWYEWQRTLPVDAQGYVPCRFDVIAMNYEFGTQLPTQHDATAIINSIQADKIILTARSDLYRGATLRELKHAGYELPRMLTQSDGATYEWRADSKSSPIPVSYRNGVFMVAGQNKGILLLDLLRRLDVSYERIVLVDDGEKNINAMREALAAARIPYHGVWYTHIDKTIDPRKVQAGIDGWSALKLLLSSTYPERLHRLESSICAY